MTKPTIYDSCSTLPIYNFFKIVDTKNFNYLKVDENVEIDEDSLAVAFAEILCEYNELTKNKKLIKTYKSAINLEYLEAKYYTSKELLSIYLETGNLSALLTLRKFGFTVDTSESIMPQIKRINKTLIGIKNKIKIETGRIINPTLKEINSSSPNFDLEKQTIHMEANIPLSYKIDIHKDSIKRYVYLTQILESKIKQLNG